MFFEFLESFRACLYHVKCEILSNGFYELLSLAKGGHIMDRYNILIVFAICVVGLHAQGPLRWQETSGLITPHVHGAIVKVGNDQAYYIGGFVDAPFSKASRTVHRVALSSRAPGYTIELAPALPIGLAEIVAINLNDTAIVVLGGVD